MLQRQVRLDRRHHAIGAVAIALVDHEDVGDLHDPRLERLHIVSRARDEDDDRDVGGADDVDLVLADADGFDDDEALAGRIEDKRRVAGRAREPAHVPARRHAANEDLIVFGVRLHAQPIAENGPSGERTGRIHGDHAERFSRLSRFGREAIDQRALPRARRPGHADQVGMSGLRKDVAHQAGSRIGLVFDQRDRARHRPHVARPHALSQ